MVKSGRIEADPKRYIVKVGGKSSEVVELARKFCSFSALNYVTLRGSG